MSAKDETQASLREISDDEPEEEKEHEPEERQIHQSLPNSTQAHSGLAYRKLTTIITVVALLLGLAFSTYQTIQSSKPKVIYATRYSKEHKFRPAASPIITETLKDGRTRIRGAEPTMSNHPKEATTMRRRQARAARKKKPPIKIT